MTAEAPNPYLKTRVMTANPAELRLLLFDGAIKFAEQGRAGLESKDYEAVYNGISRCQAIIVELMTALRAEHDQELCSRLNSLYTYMYTRLMESTTERSVEKVREVLELLRYERETWALLISQLTTENASAGSLQDAPQAPTPSEGSDLSSLIGKSLSVEG